MHLLSNNNVTKKKSIRGNEVNFCVALDQLAKSKQTKNLSEEVTSGGKALLAKGTTHSKGFYIVLLKIPYKLSQLT